MGKTKSVAQKKPYKIFGDWMSTMLAERRMTQRAMALKSGMHMSTIQQYCQGLILPTKSPTYVYAISEALGLDVEIVKKKVQEAKEARA